MEVNNPSVVTRVQSEMEIISLAYQDNFSVRSKVDLQTAHSHFKVIETQFQPFALVDRHA
jgi:hypothetical protein